MHFSRVQSTIALFLASAMVLAVSSVAFAQVDDAQLITGQGVGAAELGQTVDELEDALGSDFEVSDDVRITVDFQGHVVSKDGEVQFRAAKTGPGEELTLFIVSNADYQTAEGIGPTSTIADAEDVYGDATLNWNPDNESREFASFADGPEGRIAFRTPGIGGTNVGIYGDGELETNEYQPDALIASVWVSCVAGTDCPGDSGSGSDDGDNAESTPEPTATPEPEPTPTPDAESTPEPTATPEPTPTPEPEPTPTPEPDGGDGGASGGGDDDTLARTGATELVALALVSLLFVVGGAMMVVERRFLCPAWLRRN